MKKLLIENNRLLKEYNYKRNLDKDINKLTLGSKTDIWWKCEKGHEWNAKICDRANGNGCPYCANKKILQGYNDLASQNPELAQEWNFEKNNNLLPTMVGCGSNRKVWWKCEKGHEWEAIITSRMRGTKCPYCSNQKILKGYNDFKSVYPNLLKKWNYEKNIILPDQISANTNKKVWWKCEKGHEWEASVYNVTHGAKCPYCDGHRLLKGYNDLNTVRPDLASEWSDLNKKSPFEYYYSSNDKVFWKCQNNHIYKVAISLRVSQNVGCPYCVNQKVLPGYNDIATLAPELIEKWDKKMNNGISPSNVLFGGKSKWWWKCEKGHHWQSYIYKDKTILCPYCNFRKILPGFNDLKTINPQLAMEFDSVKNNTSPDKVLYSLNNKNYWWRCNLNHSYQSSIRNRSVLGLGCPYCSNQRTLPGFNDILSHKEYSSEWNYEKNIGVDPSTINYHSIHKYWWKCKKGHEWEISPYGKKGCPICNKEKKTSLPEKIIYYYIKKYFNSALDNYSPDGFGQKNIDIYIPDFKVGIEYDGGHYHKDVNSDITKDDLCINRGITLYRVREKNCPVLNSSSICLFLKDNSYDELTKVIKKILKYLGIDNSVVNINSDLDKIYDLIDYSEKQKSLAEIYPNLLKEWDYEKNGKLRPDLVGAKSSKIVWWKCEKGHSYQSKIEDRTHKYNGCPICANRRALKGYNDLETNNPKLAEEWNYEKNNGLVPSQVVYGGTKKYWWKCEKGHEFETSMRVRIKGSGCPYCSNHKILIGYNDLASKNPKLACEWDYEKNLNLTPKDVFTSGSQRVWWRCKKCGFSWQATINNRNRGKSKCPKCKNAL